MHHTSDSGCPPLPVIGDWVHFSHSLYCAFNHWFPQGMAQVSLPFHAWWLSDGEVCPPVPIIVLLPRGAWRICRGSLSDWPTVSLPEEMSCLFMHMRRFSIPVYPLGWQLISFFSMLDGDVFLRPLAFWSTLQNGFPQFNLKRRVRIWLWKVGERETKSQEGGWRITPEKLMDISFALGARRLVFQPCVWRGFSRVCAVRCFSYPSSPHAAVTQT